MQPEFIVLLLFAIGALLLLAWYFSGDQVLKRKLLAVPVSAIGDLRPGALARVTGHVREDGFNLSSPFGSQPCVWYGAWVDEYRSHGKSGSWRQIVHEEQFVDFALDDGRDSLRVVMRDPQVVSDRSTHGRSGTFDDATHVEQSFLTRHGRDSTGLLGFNRKLRYREASLELGERVTVLGRVRQGKDGRFVMDADPELGLVLSDDGGVAA